MSSLSDTSHETAGRDPAADPPAPRPSSVSTLVAVALASLMVPLAVTGPAVALTTMATDLSASSGSVQWVLNSYNVTFAASLLAAGGLADRYGRRTLLVLGTVIYAVMAAVSGLSGSILLVDVARGVQGVGSACILTSGAAILAGAFEGPARARAFGVLGTAFGAGLALGPLMAGVLVDTIGWRAVFLVNVVFALVVLALVPRVTDSRNPVAGALDLPGLVTFSASLFLLTLGFVQGPLAGWGSTATIGAFVASAVFMALFVRTELRSAHPMFDLSLFRRTTFVAVMAQPFTIVFGFVILVVYLPSYFQGVGGRSAAVAGALLLPMMVPVFVLPLVVGVVAARVPLRYLLATSSLLIALGSLWLVTLAPDSSWTALLGPLLVFGLGVGSAFGVMDNAAVSVVPVERAGAAAGMFNTMRITGESIATAGCAALLGSLVLSDLRADRIGLTGDQARTLAVQATQGRPGQAAEALPTGLRGVALDAVSTHLTSAFHVVTLVLALLALAGAVLTFLVVKDSELNPES